MTLDCLDKLEQICSERVWKGSGTELPKEIRELEDFDMYVLDAIGFLRGIQKENKFSANYTSCDYIRSVIASHITKVLENTPIHTYVFSLDLCASRRPEKTETIRKRVEQQKRREKKYGRDEYLDPPYEGNRYFELGKPLIADMNKLFSIGEARIQFYEFITEFFMSKVFMSSCIPDDKRVIVRGLVGTKDLFLKSGKREKHLESMKIKKDAKFKFPAEDRYYLDPIFITNEGYKWMLDIHHLSCPEADIDCYRWLLRYSNYNTVVHSNDGDLIPIGLMQSRLWNMAYTHLGIKRKVLFRTRRSKESVAPTEEESKKHEEDYLKYQKAIKDGKSMKYAVTVSGGVTTKNKRKRTVWEDRYYDLVGIREDIMDINVKGNTSEGKYVPNFPIEEWVVVFILSSTSHDFIKRANFVRGVGSEYIISSYLRFRRDWPGDLVTVKYEGFHVLFDKEEDSGDEGTAAATEDMEVDDLFADDDRRTQSRFYYTVNTEMLAKWSKMCHYEAKDHKINKSKKNNTDAKLAAARKKAADTAFSKNKRSDNELSCAAGQLAWILQYYGNGPQIAVGIESGLERDKDGKYLYGYKDTGFCDPGEISLNKEIMCPLSKK